MKIKIIFIVFFVSIIHCVYTQFTLNGTNLVYAAAACASGKFKKTNSANQTAYTLTSGSFQNGAFWACDAINLNTSFKLTFNANFGSDVGGGDGIAFVLEAEVAPPNIIGGRGGGIGFAQGDGSNCQGGTCPITPSVVVELDTWDNSATVGINDIAAHHVAIHKNGSQSTTNTLAGPTELIVGGTGVVDGADHQVCITWDVSLLQYTVYFDGILRTTYNGDIRTPIGAGTTYWGFTSGTGGAANAHKVTSVVMTTGVTSPTCAITLPIELTSFEGKNEGESNKIEWTTSSERNNKYFTLEKSENGIDYIFLTSKEGAGNSSETNTYSFDDFYPYEEFTYYRISQTDFDGKKTELGIIYVLNNESTHTKINKNPFEDICSIQIDANESTFKELIVIDISGKIIYKNKLKLLHGMNEINIDFSTYRDGIYFIVIHNEHKTENFRVNKISN